MARIGLIAGNGRFPFLALHGARGLGHDVTIVAVKEEAFPELEGAAQAAGATHSFVTLLGGGVTATLTTVGPDPAKNVGFSLGTFNATLNVCSAVFDNPAALQTFEFKANATTLGSYCVRVYDNGNITTDNVPYSYTVTVKHPQ